MPPYSKRFSPAACIGDELVTADEVHLHGQDAEKQVAIAPGPAGRGVRHDRPPPAGERPPECTSRRAKRKGGRTGARYGAAGSLEVSRLARNCADRHRLSGPHYTHGPRALPVSKRLLLVSCQSQVCGSVGSTAARTTIRQLAAVTSTEVCAGPRCATRRPQALASLYFCHPRTVNAYALHPTGLANAGLGPISSCR